MNIRLSAYEISILHKVIDDYLERSMSADPLEEGNRRVLQGIVEKLYPEQRQHVALAAIFDRIERGFGIVYYNGPGKNVTVEGAATGAEAAELGVAKNIDDAAEIIRRRLGGSSRYGIHWYD